MAASAAIAKDRLSDALAADRAIRAAVASASAPRPSASFGVHEAVRPSRTRKLARDAGGANRIVGLDAAQLRTSARALERDHDLARHALNVLVQNTVGSGIDVMPAPRKSGDKVNRELAQQLRDLWDAWWDQPEVTWTHDFGKCQQLLARSAYRDGEVFWQQLAGPVALLEHGAHGIPFSLELLESDMVPLSMYDTSRNIQQGIELNAWGRRVAFWIYKRHPGEGIGYIDDTKRVPAEQVQQFAMIDRIGQVRGLSIFASVMTRMRDIQDYEDSERIAAKVAASLCAQITKGNPEAYGGTDSTDATGVALDRAYRSLSMVPGMIADDLLPGESIEVLDSKRPNPNVAAYVDGQLRRVAGGLGTSFSSLSMNYNGTYSAQRQELVEKYGAYAMLGEQFVARVMRPVWAAFVKACLLSGAVRMPAGWTLRELTAAVYIRPQMPWIDPLKEALARGEMEDRGWQAPQQNIQLIGNDPEEVLRLREDWAQQNAGLALPGGSHAQPAPEDDPNARHPYRAALIAYALKETE